jgi:hypothetical protein
MRPITVDQGFQDLSGWLAADAGMIEKVRRLNGGGGWEQWCVIQFLRWQLDAQPPGFALDYQRELSFQSGSIRRRFDIAYNYNNVNPTTGHPLILTQWKTGNDGNYVSMEVTKDLETLAEVGRNPNVVLIVVVLCAQRVDFPGVAEVGPFRNTEVRLYHSTNKTWEAVGVLRF